MTTYQHFVAYANSQGWSVKKRALLWRLAKQDLPRYEREGWPTLERDLENLSAEEYQKLKYARNPRRRRKMTAAEKRAFVARMKAARSKSGTHRWRRRRNVRHRRPKVHTARFDRCVTDVKRSLRKYRRKGNADAICQATLGKRAILKRHRRRNRRPLPSARVIEVQMGRKIFYYSREGILSTSRAAAHRFASDAAAERIARALAGAVPRGSHVYVAG